MKQMKITFDESDVKTALDKKWEKYKNNNLELNDLYAFGKIRK
jgi:hypothetical protein